MKVIELTGVPCAGKSTLANELVTWRQCVLFDQDWLVSEMGSRRAGFLPARLLPRRFVYESALMLAGIRMLGPNKIRQLARACRKAHWPAKRRLNVFRNIVHKYGIHHYAHRADSSKWLLIDEGISHISFLFATSAQQCPLELLGFYPYGRPAIVKLVSTPEELALRLSARGHAMLEPDGRSVDEFVEMNSQSSALQDRFLNKTPLYLEVGSSQAGDVIKFLEEHADLD